MAGQPTSRLVRSALPCVRTAPLSPSRKAVALDANLQIPSNATFPNPAPNSPLSPSKRLNYKKGILRDFGIDEIQPPPRNRGARRLEIDAEILAIVTSARLIALRNLQRRVDAPREQAWTRVRKLVKTGRLEWYYGKLRLPPDVIK